ncbi:S8 family serine peptidase [Arthrobacter sp. Soil782]|uniref:S8 family serine peptidase n=1 Tax=Arthrobacter sp. Soil782 TaxID=1736410 RepID=UPI0009E72FA4|nr:S8 family serine peptidase [Arthrobacter sp. Soil782]
MSKSYRRRSGRAVLASLTGLALASSMWAPASAVQAPDSDNPTAEGITLQPAIDSKISRDLAGKTGTTAAYVQFAGKGAFEQTQPAEVRSNGFTTPIQRTDRVLEIRAGIQTQADEVAAEAGASQLYTTTNTLPGVAIQGDAEAIKALAARPDVVKITGIVPKTIENKGADIDTRALEAWTARDNTGEGITIAVLDTGLDYTHAGFGGPGTIEAFNQAKADAEPDPALYDAAKFLGGYDLVGDAYDAGSTDPARTIPQPDLNPLDCQSHGSHVAGTSSGYGVNADGTTFEGDYSTLTAETVNEMRIGPGSAPESGIVALRVFGCEGSSLVVGQALDYVLDPNRDGNFDDRAQVVNMSLGSSFPAYDDPENDIVNELTEQGVLSVVSSGNDGDVYDIGGSPGSAESALTVAASVGSQVTLDRVDVLAPEAVAGPASGQYTVNFDYAAEGVTPETLRGEVVMGPDGANNDGCDALPAAGDNAGKWVWLFWDDNDTTRDCGSADRWNNAAAAGYAGVVIGTTLDVFPAGIGGNDKIPGLQLTAADTARLMPAAEAGTLVLQLDPSYQATATGPSNAKDTLAAFSSRGVHGSNGVVKPDVTAPGVSIGSVQVGTGNGASTKSGTSMAAPHTAGIAALVLSANEYNPYQAKSVIMNTATHDLLTADGIPYAPNRVGSGRVDAMQALETSVLAYATEQPALTSVNFGVLELGTEALTVTKQVTVQNTSNAPVTYDASYLAASTTPGVAISVSPAVITVPANNPATLTVTLTIADPAALAKTIDPAAEEIQAGIPRQYLADVSGRIQLLGADGQELRVPVYSAPKPTSDISAGTEIAFDGASDLLSSIALEGRGLSQGVPGESAYQSIVSPLVLGAESPKAAERPLESLYSFDLRAVGAASTVPALVDAAGDPTTGVLNFGISTWQNWAQLGGNNGVSIELDTDGDSTVDYVVQTLRYSDLGPGAPTLDMILFEVVTIDDAGAPVFDTDLYFANGVDGSVDTNTFDTNVVTLPVPVTELGMNAATLGASAPIKYRVSTASAFNVDENGVSGGPVDTTDWIDFNVTEPALWFEGGEPAAASFASAAGVTLNVNRQESVTDAKALFIHHHNATGDKQEIVPISVAGATVNEDLDGDGNPDVVVRNSAGQLLLYPGNGTGGFLKSRVIGTGWNSMNAILIPGDWDGDGNSDVISRDSSGRLWLYKGTGTGTVTGKTQIGQGWSGLTMVTPGDWDGDGNVDLIARLGDGKLRLYPGNGAGGFLTPDQIGSGWNGFTIVGPGDFNGDTAADLLARDSAGKLFLYPGTGTGGFGTRTQPGQGWNNFTLVAPGDFDGDSNADLLARDSAGKLFLYSGNGTGGFAGKVQNGTGWGGFTWMVP